MTFKSALWYPVAAVLGLANLVAIGFAAGTGEPLHAAVHAALAVAFGSWAQRLRRSPAGGERQARLEELEDELDTLRRELSEAQERLDFAERILAQGQESRRVGPEP